MASVLRTEAASRHTGQPILFIDIRLIYYYIVKQAISIVATVENPRRERVLKGGVG